MRTSLRIWFLVSAGWLIAAPRGAEQRARDHLRGQRRGGERTVARQDPGLVRHRAHRGRRLLARPLPALHDGHRGGGRHRPVQAGSRRGASLDLGGRGSRHRHLCRDGSGLVARDFDASDVERLLSGRRLGSRSVSRHQALCSGIGGASRPGRLALRRWRRRSTGLGRQRRWPAELRAGCFRLLAGSPAAPARAGGTISGSFSIRTTTVCRSPAIRR